MSACPSRRPSLREKVVVLAAALLAGLAVSAAHASAMSVAASGHLGAGSAPAQSSCLNGPVAITPRDATKFWDVAENFWVYPDVVVSGDFRGCAVGDRLLLTVFVPGSAPTTIAAEYALRPGDLVAQASFTVTLATATSGKRYLPATAIGNSSYGLLVRS